MIPLEIISEFKKIGKGQVLTLIWHSDSAKNDKPKRTNLRELPENDKVLQKCVEVFTDAVSSQKYDDVVLSAYYVYENRKPITSFAVYGMTYKDGVLYSQIKLI
jgi:hypothetical protein